MGGILDIDIPSLLQQSASNAQRRRIHQYRAMVLLGWGIRMVDNFPILLHEATDARKILRRHDRVIWYLQMMQRGALAAGILVQGLSSLSRAQKRRYRFLTRRFGRPDLETKKCHSAMFLKAWERAEILATEVPLLREALDRIDLYHYNQLTLAQMAVEMLTKEYWRLAVHQKHVEDLIVFKNGWKWVYCLYASSPWEARFMHHCGNMGCKDPHERMLSLREPVACGRLTLWKPHLTFTSNFGMIIEMKGRENKKPASVYYSYIRELFLHHRISGLSSKLGALPSRDLEWADLPVEMRAEIAARRYFVFHTSRVRAMDEWRNPKPPLLEESGKPSLWQRYVSRFPALEGALLILAWLACLTVWPYYLVISIGELAGFFTR